MHQTYNLDGYNNIRITELKIAEYFLISWWLNWLNTEKFLFSVSFSYFFHYFFLPLPLFIQNQLYESLVLLACLLLFAAALRWIYTTSGEYEERERKKETHERIGKKKNIQKLQIRKPTASSRLMQLVLGYISIYDYF